MKKWTEKDTIEQEVNNISDLMGLNNYKIKDNEDTNKKCNETTQLENKQLENVQIIPEILFQRKKYKKKKKKK